MIRSHSDVALKKTVIDNGYCVGCGACAVPDNSPFSIKLDEFGQYRAYHQSRDNNATDTTDYEQLCPFGSRSQNEDWLSQKHVSKGCEHNAYLGFYDGVYAGHVRERAFRAKGSSGGMGTWILSELLEQGMVDAVLHVKSVNAEVASHELPFTYQVSDTPEQIQQGGKSRYYPIELSEVLEIVKKNPKRYAVVGLPCFIKSIRLLQESEPELAERIVYCVGLVCGHLKSANYGESLAWQMGIPPEELREVDFRVKDPDKPANRYSTYAKGVQQEQIIPTNQLFGTDWGAGAFKYKACDFCDDVFAETADIVLGDAWLPSYIDDSQGTNIVITRRAEIKSLLQKATSEKRIVLDDLPVQEAVKSQDAGLRHRKVNLHMRLEFAQALGNWTPKKRDFNGGVSQPKYERQKQALRVKMRDTSHASFKAAKESNDFSLYHSAMSPLYSKYKKVGLTLQFKLKSKVRGFLNRMSVITGRKP